MNSVKVKLSSKEFDLMMQPDFILTKNNIIQKVCDLFSNTYLHYQNILQQQHFLPKEILVSQIKIAKGEQYLLLPWVMMDYPKYFSANNVFAIRTFFWWGNYFSVTLHLSGIYLQQWQHVVTALLQQNHQQEWQFCIHEQQWNHYFETDNYQPLHALHLVNLSERNFIKLAKKIPLQEWDNAVYLFENAFQELMNAMHPNDGKAL
jgi:hypothetical protein